MNEQIFLNFKLLSSHWSAFEINERRENRQIFVHWSDLWHRWKSSRIRSAHGQPGQLWKLELQISPYASEICTGRILSARPGPARRPHGPARPAGPNLSLGPGPFRPVAWPSPARPGPVRSGPTKQFPWDFLKLFNLIKQSLFNGFVGYLFVTDAPQGWIPTCICKKYIDQRWKNYHYNWEIRTL